MTSYPSPGLFLTEHLQDRCYIYKINTKTFFFISIVKLRQDRSRIIFNRYLRSFVFIILLCVQGKALCTGRLTHCGGDVIPYPGGSLTDNLQETCLIYTKSDYILQTSMVKSGQYPSIISWHSFLEFCLCFVDIDPVTN